MAGLISRKHDKKAPDEPGISSLFVGGVRYINSAAKFWPSLIDEVREDFPDCSLIELTASFAEKLHRRHLFPAIAFEEDFHLLLSENLRDAIREALAEMELLGPPSSVRIRLLSGRREVLSRGLPLDCVDAEIFPYLAVWLLEWAGIPASRWNSEFLSGDIMAEDRKRRLVYRLSFSLTNRHLSEGLYQRSVSIVP